MGKLVRGILVVAAAMALAAVWSAPAVAQQPSCPTAPAYDSRVPTPESVLGFPLGIGQPQPVTSEQIVSYVQAVDAASDRVISFDIGTTWGGRPLKVAVVSSREHMRPAELRRIRERFVAHREGRSGRDDDLRDSPAIVWLAGNVHGGEKSGADAELKVLYELAARTDCECRKLNDDLVTVIMPSQNPDGREASRRQNDYGFDLNRDWFARTQPETEAKVELLRRWPRPGLRRRARDGRAAVLLPAQRRPDPPRDRRRAGLVDQRHRRGQQGGLRLQRRARGRRRPRHAAPMECYFNYSVYDLFFMGYGDTVPTTGFGAAGMTYEKGSSSPTALRVDQQFRTHWATVAGPRRTAARCSTAGRTSGARPSRRASRVSCSPTRSSQPGQHRATSRCRTSASAPTSCAPTARSATCASSWSGCGGWTSRSTGCGRRSGSRTPASSAAAARPGRGVPGRLLLDLDEPAAEALDPGDARRGPVRPVPVLLRRLVLEQPAADGRADPLHRRPRAAVRGARPRARRRRAAPAAARAPTSTRSTPRRPGR